MDNIDQRLTKLEASNAQLADSLTASLTASLNDALNKQTANIKSVQDQLTASIQTVDKNQSAALTNLNNTISGVKSSVQDEATKRATDTTTLTDKVNTINTSLSALTTRVSTLETSVKNLKAAVSSSGDLTADITSTSNLDISDGYKTFTGTMVVKVTNDTGDDVTGVKLSFTFDADEDIPDVSSATLTGGSITWTYVEQDGNTLYFKNKTGFSVSDGNYKKMTLTLKVTLTSAVTTDTSFDVNVDITSYS